MMLDPLEFEKCIDVSTDSIIVKGCFINSRVHVSGFRLYKDKMLDIEYVKKCISSLIDALYKIDVENTLDTNKKEQYEQKVFNLIMYKR